MILKRWSTKRLILGSSKGFSGPIHGHLDLHCPTNNITTVIKMNDLLTMFSYGCFTKDQDDQEPG